ncbi:penicillin-binding protein 1A [Labrys sp. LIt4]|uniref:Penicillin-binding protein 1A n=1 Tax=Labrys okinawensis TaxID=346911 RepID=A0A2S9QBN5_9HYPH|nr:MULTISPECIES: penicillin-binding protein 1A [Labrys]MBP0582958.1 penicillin-binding protein 1A [Labrys sp. LIt4]PRH86757.1 penicillin-binding protein [Labrys okinawensis]
MRLFVRFLGFLFTTASMLFLVGGSFLALYVWANTRDLPDTAALKDYEPPVMTRVHAGDGALLAEYARQRRLYLPIEVMPPLLIHAFMSAEDNDFYNHVGIDPKGVLRALIANVTHKGRRQQGASTITQQVAKNFFLAPDQNIVRKIKEAILALRMEQTYSKDKILELYLNEIYLGMGNYGVAAAALNYFGKSVDELGVAQVAYLAALPKGPNNYNPIRNHDAAVGRRNWVIDQMVSNGYISKEEGRKAQAEPLAVTPRSFEGAQSYAANYFTEEVRREIAERYGEDKLYEGGLSVRTTLDPKLQRLARDAMVQGLVRFDERGGFRGPVKNVDLGEDWGLTLGAEKRLSDIKPWQLAIVLDSSDNSARIGLQPPLDRFGSISTERPTGTINLDGVKWARSRVGKVSQILKVGDIIYVEPKTDGTYRLRQIPEISGAMVVMDPYTGRVLAMVGGFSFDQSEFNRATQAQRQPGSSFKPFVYATAIDNGYTPASVVMDAPIEINQGNGETWRPANYSNKFYGPQTLRFGIEYSRNVMTVRLAQDVGMPLIAEYARRFGVYDDLPSYLSGALGAGTTTVMRMVAGYGMLENGGRLIKPTLIDRIQDRWGKTIYKHDERICQGCNADDWNSQDEPRLLDPREQVLDPMTAYQVTSMLEGVIQHGSAQTLRSLNRPIAGKTGTTSDEKDAWFIGYSPDLVCGLYVGYDTPRHIGNKVTGGSLAAPIFGTFMKTALADKAPVPFRVPPGIKLIRIDRKTGMRSEGSGAILEAFKPGTAPPDNYTVIGSGGGSEGGGGGGPVSMGTGDLY